MSKIISAPNSVLSQTAPNYIFKKARSASFGSTRDKSSGQEDKFLSGFLKKMEDALLTASDPKGVGLAAPQIGKSLAIFITKPSEKSKISVFINPRIIESDGSLLQGVALQNQTKKKRVKKLEGCLSLQNIWGEVLRAPVVTIEYQTHTGKKQTKKFTGFMATIVQHEVDHLNGILFPKRVLEQKGKLYKSYKNEKGHDEFEELSI